jgi:hypothetical protein
MEIMFSMKIKEDGKTVRMEMLHGMPGRAGDGSWRESCPVQVP